ncbi:hypothetical protein [Flavobacterium psychrophilum]|uniref:hypothetical protein n=1 Tax=Flavobacterium psychrophilum TaxID=96345 RepID=UPI00106D416E|nr:hypothetical protein [Flavobacterium psychrophilum]
MKIEILKNRKKIFINKASLYHNDAFNYDKVVYVNSNSKVIITCKKHSDFEQVPQDHLRGNGCVECNGRKKITRQEFIEEANKIHNQKFNYDKVVYVNKAKKVIITCKKHGDFLQIAANHLRGHGCMECSGKTEKNTEKFIAEANLKHNFRYNYNKVNYTKAHAKVIITCKIHGDFTQAAYSHLCGIGCAECSGKAQRSTETFIEKAKKIHNNFYNYDNTVYTNKNEKIIITCKKHGDFEQVPNDHLRGHGCCECSGTKRSTTQKFVEAVIKIHKHRYNYDKVEYLNMKTKVIIKCKKHGDFGQIPNDHLNGSGCPKCKSSKGEKIIYEVLKKLNVKFEAQYKFEDCIHKNKLPFDFAVFINAKTKLIEFHGKQHYELNNYFHSKSELKFKECLIRDKIKQDYAEENKIDLLIIPYNQILNIEALVVDFYRKNEN